MAEDGPPLVLPFVVSDVESSAGALTVSSSSTNATLSRVTVRVDDVPGLEGGVDARHVDEQRRHRRRAYDALGCVGLWRACREGDGWARQRNGISPSVTVDASTEPELVNRSFGAHVVFDQPGAAERAMYFGTSPLWSGGHDSAGVTALSNRWFLAEGATGSFFDTFVLIANPLDAAATVTMTYLPASGAPIEKTHTIAVHQRLTINIADEDPALASAAVSTRVEADQPVIAERSQYWPHITARDGRTGREDLRRGPVELLQRRDIRTAKRRARARRRILRRAHRFDAADRRRTLRLQQRQRRHLGRRHKRHGHAAALMFGRRLVRTAPHDEVGGPTRT